MSKTSGLNWVARNSLRSYPVEESAPKKSRSGEILPDDILIGANFTFPESAGDRISIGGITVTSNLVTAVVYLSESDLSSSVTAAAVVSVPQPVVPGRPYPVEAYVDGVKGWLAFGSGAAQSEGSPRTWNFGSPASAPIIMSEARPYADPHLFEVYKPGFKPGAEGLIRLVNIGDLIIEGADRDLGDGPERVILFRMDLSRNRDALEDYAGPCAQRPESQNCDFVPINQINAVFPDEYGNINIEFEAPFLLSAFSEGSADVDFPISHVEACEAKKRLPDEDGNMPPLATEDCDVPTTADEPLDPLPDPVVPDYCI